MGLIATQTQHTSWPAVANTALHKIFVPMPVRSRRWCSGSAGRMSACALQRQELLRILALGGAILASRLRHAVTAFLCTLLGSCGGHKSGPPTDCCNCRMHTDCARMCGYRLVWSKCSACFRLVSVSLAPLSMRAISWVRSESSMRRTSVCVRPRFSVFSIRKCWSPKAAICGR
jgi:hypothetical protein